MNVEQSCLWFSHSFGSNHSHWLCAWMAKIYWLEFRFCDFVDEKAITHFGTITNNVVKYSESRMKCSFFTRSAKLRVNKLPLVAKCNEIDKLKFTLIYRFNGKKKPSKTNNSRHDEKTFSRSTQIKQIKCRSHLKTKEKWKSIKRTAYVCFFSKFWRLPLRLL